MENYVGFASLPNQVYRKSVKRGFEFALMVVGELMMPLMLECLEFLIVSFILLCLGMLPKIYVLLWIIL